MKDIAPRLIELFKSGYCTPQISRLARKLKEPATTLHYNIKKLEGSGALLACKAVFDYKKVGMGFCTYILLTLSPDEYGDPERIGKELAKLKEVESIDVITGDWEIIAKIRTKDIDEYYGLVKNVISRPGINKIKSLTSMKQLKSEFVTQR